MEVQNREWEGPYKGTFNKTDEGTNTIKYKNPDHRNFTFYVPREFIKQVFGSGLPVVLHVAILKSVSPTRELGFTGKSLARRATSEYWEYDFRTEDPKGKSFDPQPGSSYLYETRVNDQPYTIYIPHDVMNDETPPWRIMVVLEIPEQ